MNENMYMKIYIATLVIFQLGELACYSILYSHVNNHNKEMLQTSTISNDMYLVNFCLKHINLG